MVHLYTYLAIALSFAHQFSTGTDFRYTSARVVWPAMYLAVATALPRYRFFEPLRVNWPGWACRRSRKTVTDRVVRHPPQVSLKQFGMAWF